MRILAVMVKRNVFNSQRVDIPPHEMPVLAYVHGEESLTVLGELIVDRDIPSAGEEYQRLAQKYGRDKANESLEPRISAVYGAGRRGVEELQRAIDYGQDEAVPAEAFVLAKDEPSHDMPGSNSVLQRTQYRPLAHVAPPAGSAKKRRQLPRVVDRMNLDLGEAGGAQVEQLQEARASAPAAMQQGASAAKRAKTLKAEREQRDSAGTPAQRKGAR